MRKTVFRRKATLVRVSMVTEILENAGLSHLAAAFEGLSLQRFKSLLLPDYDKFGVCDLSDKQALFKLIQSLNADDFSLTISPPQSPTHVSSQVFSSPSPILPLHDLKPELETQGLIDFGADDDDDDDDFLEDDLDAEAFSEVFMRSVTPDRLDKMTVLDPLPMQSKGSAGSSLQANKSSQHGQLDKGTIEEAGKRKTGEEDASDATALAHIADPPRIRVIVRKRPLNRKEIERGDTDVLECDSSTASLYVHEPKLKVDLTRYTDCHTFRFDDVFDEFVDNDTLYSRAVRPLIATVFRAGKGTCFAYGQTGSGKTYTMQPLPLRAAADIFNVIAAVPEFQTLQLHVACYEIYGGKIFDLLNERQRLEVREDGKRRVQVVGLKEVEVNGVQALGKLCDRAACCRSTGCTGANDESSRSHSIMTFALRAPSDARQTLARQKHHGRSHTETETPLKTIGKLSFIDLAGSERGADTYDNDKQTRLEGAEINKSLLALKECIRALDAEAKHIPFRGSKLTEVLRDSFIGKNARTVMIANVSPNSTSCEHTLNTLRYADRVKEIKKDTPRTLQPTSSTGVAEIAALLHRLPPPSVPVEEPKAEKAEKFSSLPPQDASSSGGIHQSALRRPPRLSAIPVGEMKHTPVAPSPKSADPSPTKLKPVAPKTKIVTKISTVNVGNGNGYSNNNNNSNSTGSGKFTPRSENVQSQGVVPLTKKNDGGFAQGKMEPKIVPPMREQNRALLPMPSPPGSEGSPRTSSSGNGQKGGGALLTSTNRKKSIFAHPLAHDPSDIPQIAGNLSNQSNGLNGEENGVFDVLLAAEEELIAAHRDHIEGTMTRVREEMELLAQLDSDDKDGGGMGIETYMEELNHLLVEKAASIASLQQQLAAFKRQFRAATGVSNLTSSARGSN